MDQINKQHEENLLKKVYREVPSQHPMNVTRSSYNKALSHCKTFGNGLESVWACRRTGEKQVLTVTFRTVWNRDNTLNAAEIPVGIIHCPACDKKTEVKRGDPIYADEVSTLSM